MVLKKSTPGKFPYTCHFQQIGINGTKIEKTGIHFKTDVFAAVAVVDAKAPYSPRVRESKTALDYKSHSVDSIFQSFSVELVFWIPFLSGIPDSFSCILGSKAQDSGFNEQNFPGIRILQAKISHIPESGFLYMRRYVYILFIFWVYFLYFTQFAGGSHCLNFDKFLDQLF